MVVVVQLVKTDTNVQMKWPKETEFYTPTNALLYTLKYQSKMFILKHLKTLQHHHSYHLQGARMFLVKVTDLKFVKNVKSQCGDAAA